MFLTKHTIAFFLLSAICITLTAQNLKSIRFSYNWKEDSLLTMSAKGINASDHFLATLKINSKQFATEQFDSIYIAKGIFQLNEKFQMPQSILDNESKEIVLQIKLFAIINNELIHESDLKVILPPKPKVLFTFTDSSLNFQYPKSTPIPITIINEFVEDSISKIDKESFNLIQDTIIRSWDLYKDYPFRRRKVVVLLKKDTLTKIDYTQGIFIKNDIQPTPYTDPIVQQSKFLNINGELFIENNAFKNAPEHAQGMKYPSTIISTSNQININDVPFQLNAFHNTADKIDPNFQNFFSFSLNINALRSQVKEKLIAKEKESIPNIKELDQSINSNAKTIESLEQYKRTLLNYPNQKIDISELLSKTEDKVKQSEAKDSLLTPLNNSNNLREAKDTLPSTNEVNNGSLPNKNIEEINRINKLIKQLKASNNYKEKIKTKQLEQPVTLDYSKYDSKSIYQKAANTKTQSLLLRFENLELGNFYEYAGQYSIRDIEMKGVNTSYLINQSNKVSFLYGKINSFQSFNLDEIDENIKATSVSFENSTYDFAIPSIRLSRFHDETIDEELSSLKQSNYVLSTSINGEINDFLFYEVEYNQSTTELKQPYSNNEKNKNNDAFYSKIAVSPFHFLEVNAQLDQVGSNYKSEGVYFLNRNTQSFAVGSHLKLFKNKIHLKGEYATINRNHEEKELTNQTKKVFFDIGSRFNRIPNFQIIHSPVTVAIANNIDTAFSNLNGFSTVTISRVFYIKKIKQTVLNTALIYNEIVNDFLNTEVKQQNFQHFFSIANEKTQFSLTSSYNNIFEKLRFISASISRNFKDGKYQTDLYYAKNFMEDQYKDILRLKLSGVIHKNFSLGAGANVFFKENGSTNVGSVVSLRVRY